MFFCMLIIIDANQQQIPLIIFQSISVLLFPDLIQCT